MSDKKFDVTTAAGLQEADHFLDSQWGLALFPVLGLARALGKWIAAPSDVSPENQAAAAERIIEAGRKNGAKRIRVTIHKHVGGKLKGNIKEARLIGPIRVTGSALRIDPRSSSAYRSDKRRYVNSGEPAEGRPPPSGESGGPSRT